MNRRQLLKLLVSGVVGHTLDLDRLLWTPNTKTIFIPHPRQVEFFNRPIDINSLYGIPYHESNACAGTWMGIVRSTTPLNWKGILDRVVIDPKKGLYVINSKRVDGNVGMSQQNRETSQGNNQHYKTTTNRGRTKEN